MYGSQTINDQQLVIAQSFKIVNDSNGIFSFLFRMVQNAIKIINTPIENLISVSDSHVNSFWIQFLYQAEQQQNVDPTPLISQLSLNQSFSNNLVNLKKLIISLPEKLTQLLFNIRQKCNSCQNIEDYLLINKSNNLQQRCQKCQSPNTQILKLPVIMMFYAGQSIQLKTKLNNQNYYLNTVLTNQQQNNHSIFVDFNSFQEEIFVLNDSSGNLSNNQLTYLKPKLVYDYLHDSNYNALQNKIGTKQLICFFNEQFMNQSQQMKISQAFNQLQKSTNVLSVMSPSQQKQNSQMSDFSNSSDYGKKQTIKPLQKSTILTEQKQQQQFSYGRVHLCSLTWPVYLLIALVLVMMLVSIVMMAVFQYYLNNTIVMNNVQVTQPLFIGIDQVQSSNNIQNYIAQVQNRIPQLNSSLDSINKLNATSTTSFTTYTNYINVNQISASKSTLGTIINSPNVVCTDTSIQAPTNFDPTRLQFKNITAQNTFVQTNQANKLIANLNLATFPNIDRLIVDNLTTNIANTNLLNTKIQKTKNMTVQTTLLGGNLNTTTSETPKYVTSNSAISGSTTYTNTNITTLETNKSLLIESASISINNEIEMRGNVTLALEDNPTNITNLSFNGNTLNLQDPLISKTAVLDSIDAANTLNATTANINNFSCINATTPTLNTSTLSTTTAQYSSASFTTNLIGQNFSSSYLNMTQQQFQTNQLQLQNSASTLNVTINATNISGPDLKINQISGSNANAVIMESPYRGGNLLGNQLNAQQLKVNTNANLTTVTATNGNISTTTVNGNFATLNVSAPKVNIINGGSQITVMENNTTLVNQAKAKQVCTSKSEPALCSP